VSDRIEGLLSDLLAEMKSHHAYIVARDAELAAKEEQDDSERIQRQNRIDAAMKHSIALQEKGIAAISPLPENDRFEIPPPFAGGNAR
jgi:hypothetical protein